jgi:BirA family biotin operon repressor/biotin-[acetyl-CoA-carboxylase] ligase
VDDDEAATSDLTEAALAQRLTTVRLGRRHTHVSMCASTNDLLAALARQGAEEGLVVSADAQSGGRGRLGRAWHSPPGMNLHVSLLLRPRCRALDIPPLTLLAGGALARSVRRLGIDATVKWPNDLLAKAEGGAGGRAGFRKLAGILTEAVTEAGRVIHVIVGIGVNVNIDSFPEGLADTAVSLRQLLGRPLSRAQVLAQLLADFEGAYADFQARGAAAAVALWEAHAHLGQRCRARGTWGDVEGITTGVGPAGELLVRDDQGVVHAVVSGEVLPIG